MIWFLIKCINVSEQEIRKFAQRRKSFKNQSYLRKITQTLTRKLPPPTTANINSQNKYFQFINAYIYNQIVWFIK